MALTSAGKKHAQVLFIGRFQPFHKGHEKILAYLLERYSRVTIAIGSAQEKRTKENPFSARERRTAIASVAHSHSGWSKRIKFAFLADNRSNAAWVRSVRSRFSPASFAVASANPLVRKLLRRADYFLDPSPLFRRAEWEGKIIRKKIRQKISSKRKFRLEKHIPPSLRGWMKKKGQKIIKTASEKGT